jgi:hypothetical protein
MSIPQRLAQPPGDQDRQRQNHHADERQPPFERQHHPQHDRGLNGVRDDVDEGVADRVLGSDHVVVEAAHQLADFRIGKEPQRHALEFIKQRDAQVVDHAFADAGVQPPLQHAHRAVEHGDEEQPRRQQGQPRKISGGEHAVDHFAEDQRRDERERRTEKDQHQHRGDLLAVRTRVSHHPQEQRAGHFGLLVFGIQHRHPAVSVHAGSLSERRDELL